MELSPEARALLSLLRRQAGGGEVPKSLALACAELHEHDLVMRAEGKVFITRKGLTVLDGVAGDLSAARR